MEKELGIPTTLFGGPPELGNVIKLGKSQISFMNIFARPLFEAVTDILPAMSFTVEETKRNQNVWDDKIKEEQDSPTRGERTEGSSDQPLSPRSMSPPKLASMPDSSHPEGLPASRTTSDLPLTSMDTSGTVSDPRRKSSSSPHHQATLHAKSTSSRHSSASHVPGLPPSSSQPVLSSSRRSSGALSTSNLPFSVITTRRTSNGSPSHLQLGHDTRSRITTSTTTSENQQSNAQGSDDTLSQAQFATRTTAAVDVRQGSSNSNSSSSGRISSKGSAPDNIGNLQGSISQPSNRPYVQSGHHRSSSGAHTTNTTLSQSTPYSPTGTQATSVLSVDSDESRSQSHPDASSSPERRPVPKMLSVDQYLRQPHGLDGAYEPGPKDLIPQNGNPKEVANIGYRSLGRKGSRFNFSFFKRKGRGAETSP